MSRRLPASIALRRDPATGRECCPTLDEAARLPAATLDAIHAYLEEQLAAHLEAERATAVAERAAAEAERATAEAERATAEAERATAEAERATAEAERRRATLRRSILRMLSLRGLQPSEQERAVIERCDDADTLEQWDDRVLEATSVATLLDAAR
jgi:hypothetical protein